MFKKELYDKISNPLEDIPFKLKPAGTLPELSICELNHTTSTV
jgi:hypothetical protein